MKKVIILMALVLNLFWATAQLKTNQAISNGSINTSSAFLDASSTAAWNASSNVGKGLLFPRVNLTSFAFAYGGTVGLSTNYPTRFDGMIVYNTATGNAGIGGTAVTPGFYYYANTSSTVTGGAWVRMTDSNDMVSSASATAYYGVLTTTSPTAAQVQALATKSVGSGAYLTNFDQSALASGGYFTLAIPVSWRNPTLKIDGSDTWDVFNLTSTVTINNVIYQVWQTDIPLTTSNAVAVK